MNIEGECNIQQIMQIAPRLMYSIQLFHLIR